MDKSEHLGLGVSDCTGPGEGTTDIDSLFDGVHIPSMADGIYHLLSDHHNTAGVEVFCLKVEDGRVQRPEFEMKHCASGNFAWKHTKSGGGQL